MKAMYSRLLSLVLAAVASGQASAALLTFTDRTDFLAALSLQGLTPLTEDYQGYSAGTTIAANGGTLGALTYTYAGGFDLVVSDLYPLAPGDQYLGVDDGLDELFFGGEGIDFGFAATQAFGLDILHEGNALDGDLSLTIGGTTLDLVAGPSQQLLYFLGIIDTSATFSTASLTSAGVFSWNVDNVTRAGTGVPAPPVLALLAVGAWLAWRRPR